MPCLRRICATDMPASPSLRMATICASVKFDFFIGLSLTVNPARKSPLKSVYQMGKLTRPLLRMIYVKVIQLNTI